LWVLLAPYWAEKSDRHGRKALTLLGLAGFILSMLLCGLVLDLGLRGVIGGG
jgi:MFS family permease